MATNNIINSGDNPLNPTSISISPSVFNYFNVIINDKMIWVSSSAPNSQSSFSGVNGANYGTYTFKAAAGTYNFAVVPNQQPGNGIARFIFNGGTPIDVDCYSALINYVTSYQTSVTLVDGDNTLQLLNNGKNGSATSYTLAFSADFSLNKGTAVTPP